MIHLNKQVKQVEPEAKQVIVKSHEQHAYFKEKMTTSQPKFYANASFFSQVLCPKHYIYIYLSEYQAKILNFCEIKFDDKKYPHPLNPKVLANLWHIFKIFLFC